MPAKKKPLLRMLKFVAELKKNNYPNSISFAGQLKEMDLIENLNINCSRYCSSEK